MLEEIFQKNPEIVYRIIDGNAILVSSKDDKIMSINEVGTRIWDLLDGKTTIKEIIVKITEEFDVDQDTAKDDVQEFVEKCLKINIISE